MSNGQRTVDMKLEVVVIPVADVDRAKQFYTQLGWRLDIDLVKDDQFRVVHFTPPGSHCSVLFGKGVTTEEPGSVQGLHLIVSDVEAAHAELVERGVEVSEVFHDVGGVFHHAGEEGRLSGPHPSRATYGSFASFSDPDGNGWVFQEVTTRLPGRVEAGDTTFGSSRNLRARFAALPPRTANTRKRPVSTMKTGLTGTPNSSSASRPASKLPG